MVFFVLGAEPGPLTLRDLVQPTPGFDPRSSPVTVVKLSQYDEGITSRHGYSACGLFALATTLGLKRSQGSVEAEIDRLRTFADEESIYDNRAGIQPSFLSFLAARAYPSWKVEACSNLTVADLTSALHDGRGVVVEIQVGVAGPQGEAPSTEHPNLAHFARVLVVDEDRGKILLENSLRGDAHWELSFGDFLAVWERPETAVSIRPGEGHSNPKLHPQDVTRWALIAGREPPAICDEAGVSE